RAHLHAHAAAARGGRTHDRASRSCEGGGRDGGLSGVNRPAGARVSRRLIRPGPPLGRRGFPRYSARVASWESFMDFLNKYASQIQGITRIVIGLLFMEHGTGKVLSFPLAAGAAPHAFNIMSFPVGPAGII